MLTGKKIFGKLEQIERRYEAIRFQKIADVPAVIWQTAQHLRQIPEGVDWTPVAPGDKWGDNWLTVWFKATVKLPGVCEGKRVFVRPNLGAETLFFVDNRCQGVFDHYHPVVMLTASGVAGAEHVMGFEAYSGHSFPECSPSDKPIVITPGCKTFGGIELVLEREDVTRFVMDLGVLLSLVKSLDEHSLRRNVVMRELGRVFAIVPMIPEEVDGDVWRQAIAEAIEIMKPLLASPNAPTTPTAGFVGHSHIDTAWQWPLAETWRKCARTFSSVLNLMDQYPEMTFVQSQPCQTEKIKELYPEVFERIRARVAEGRWEPNGGMWVEPDCNMPSGEAFVRQLLVAQLTTREWFGYTSDTLWLPDVFGYSAALPQILRGAGVEFFCTTKIYWNDTTRFPYDTFVWKGIDGTPVIAHFNSLFDLPLPRHLTNEWNHIQHKDVQDGVLLPYGHGDGGGGPMAEMLEVAARVKDLEGCPRLAHTTVSKFMQGVKRDLTNIPEYVGELYLELHRGTLTSIADVKRGNRKSEIALRDAELLATLAALRGSAYPSGELLAIWKRLLTNQFHDILPGSSIVKVNEEAVAEFASIVSDAKAVSARSAATLAGSGDRMLLVNTLGWRRAEATLSGVPDGKAVSGTTCQRVETPWGEKRIAVSGLDLPSLGGRVVELEPITACTASPFRVAGDVVETPFAVARFDAAGRIASLVDKASGREVVAESGVLNGIETGEDIPEHWDNWDIDADQELKMHPEQRLMSRRIVADGPLQLRIRSEYRIGRESSLVQDTVFHSDSAQIDFETVIDWSEKHILMKAVFDIDVLAETARHEIQYGHVERPTHRNIPQDRAKFEVVCHKWVDLSEGGFGVAVLNDCKYGVSVHGNRVGLSLIKSGTHPDERADKGRHLVTYSLLPHNGAFSVESVVRPAYELNVPVLAFPARGGAVGVPSLVEVDSPNVIVESVKWAEDGGGFVVRLYEAGRSRVSTEVTFRADVKSVSECNLLEENRKPLELSGAKLKLTLRPFEIKTLRCEVRPA